MEIIVQKIDVKKGTVDYICTELRKLIHLQPRQEGKINLSLDLTKPEDISEILGKMSPFERITPEMCSYSPLFVACSILLS